VQTLKEKLALSLRHRDPEKGTPPEKFVITFELVPARASRSEVIDKTLHFAMEAAAHGRITALSITDNAGGHPALTPTALGKEIKALGMEPVIHFSCKDKNRNLIESQLFELDRAGLNTLLVITGDYPRYGFMGRAKPVYDLDSVLVLGMIQEIRTGLVINKKAPGGGVRLDPMDFHAGCVVSPFKATEAEQVQQYLKLKRKIRAGADFIITQMGFDIRKYHELRLLLDLLGLDTPLIGTVFIPDARLATVIRKGIIPGCTMPKRLLDTIVQQGSSAAGALDGMIQRAAAMTAMLCGMGFQGAHLSGPGLEYDHIRQVIELADEMCPEWQRFVPEFLFPEEKQFHLFSRDEKTGLNRKPVLAKKGNTQKLHGINIKRDGKPLHKAFSPAFLLGKAVHHLFFETGGPLFRTACRLLTSIRSERTIRIVAALEYFFKGILYDCYRCGDCYLSDLELLCPQSQCAKRLVNGPCGGSRDGWCEVWPGQKRCLYVRQYERMRRRRELLLEEARILPPRDWGLDRSSSWINFFSGRDHHHLEIPSVLQKTGKGKKNRNRNRP